MIVPLGKTINIGPNQFGPGREISDELAVSLGIDVAAINAENAENARKAEAAEKATETVPSAAPTGKGK